MSIKIRKGQAEDGGFILEGNIHVTQRELEALVAIAEGNDNKKAANKLGISYTTLRNHTYNIMKKLGAKNRTQALVKAVENGLIYIRTSEDLKSRLPGNYFVCKNCGRAFIWDDVIVLQSEPFEVNHVLLTPPDLLLCPNENCEGKATNAYPWETILSFYPEYPETPEKGVSYHIDEVIESEEKAFDEYYKNIMEGKS